MKLTISSLNITKNRWYDNVAKENLGGKIQMKKLIVTTTAALALLATPFHGKADAQEQKQVHTYAKVYYKTINLSHKKDLYKQLDFNTLPQWKTSKKVNYHYGKNYMNKKPQQQVEQPEQAEQKQTEKVEKQQPQQVEKPALTPTQPAPQQPEQTEEKPKQVEQTTDAQLSAYEQEVVNLTNAERAENGLAPLKVDGELSKVAREKSKDMSTNKYFDHNSPTYGSPFDMMKKFGITYRTAGENIAMGQRTPTEVVNAWMNSSGHRANILSKNFTHIGVGYDANGHYWTQQFIGK